MKGDFSGWATKANLKCSDGLTIKPDAFKHQDKTTVPLLWSHGHQDPDNILGHAELENRDGSVYAHAFFNNSPRAQHVKELVAHGDIKWLSIWANNLVKKGLDVVHGNIRELSLVLAGANPGAKIENVSIRHSEYEITELEDEAIIHTGIEIELHLEHAEGDAPASDTTEQKTVAEVIATLNPEQQDAVAFLIGEAISSASDETDQEVKQSAVEDDDTLNHSETDQEIEEVTHKNVFEKDNKLPEGSYTLSHEDVQGIIADAMKPGMTVKSSVEAFALSHGIENIGLLFPEATTLTTQPEWDKRDTTWVSDVLGAAKKTPFSKVRSWTADLTYEIARARGYITGSLKKDQFFTISRRETGPQTIYKRQKLDRDDIIDISDFDVVAWIKSEMKGQLEEEIARAMLVSDGREVDHPDKIQEDKIRPIISDDPYYTIQVGVNVSDASSSWEEVLDSIILNRQYMKAPGRPSFFTTASFVANLLLVRDNMGNKKFRSVADIAAEIDVEKVVVVEILDEYPDTIGVLVNMGNYNIGTNRGGEQTLFDDFDIDYNQYKYLLETRLSGALVKPKAAMHVYKTASNSVSVAVTAPVWDEATFTYTIAVQAGVNWTDGDGNAVADGDHTLAAGTSVVLNAVPASSAFHLAAGKRRWTYMRPSA
jgi:hypothetical protein